MTDNILDFPTSDDVVSSLFGPANTGHSLIVNSHLIPNVAVYDCGERIDFVLDQRYRFTFPREWAHQAASFAAEAMAIGAGWPSFEADKPRQFFASPVGQITLPAGEG